MVFSSHVFVFYFLPLALLLYYSLYKAPQRARNFSLVVLGYIFYGWANPRFVFLMFGTTFVDWLLSLVIAQDRWGFLRTRNVEVLEPGSRSRRQRTALTLSIVSNLTMLGFFKYFNFGVDTYNSLMAAMGFHHLEWSTFFRVTLPLGISFYTFQSMSYIIDVYRGEAKAMRNFIDFSCFVSMFPHLVAGPILKFSYLADQLESRVLTFDKFARGSSFFMLGMAKKIILANSCGKVAELCFNAGSLHPVDAWYGAISYALQIYFDFSGYSDMAIGLGLMLGFVFARNFDSPYRADSITDFWRRWHISLSTWLREYLYIPLGGNRKGKARTYVNLIVTMLLGGLWHGAAWNYIIWGGIHGGMLAFERTQGKTSPYKRLPRGIRVITTFLVVVMAWVFFRSGSLVRAISYLGCMVGLAHPQSGANLLGGILYQPYYLILTVVAVIVTWLLPDTWEFTQNLTWHRAIVCVVLFTVALVLLCTQSYNPFIYFIF